MGAKGRHDRPPFSMRSSRTRCCSASSVTAEVAAPTPRGARGSSPSVPSRMGYVKSVVTGISRGGTLMYGRSALTVPHAVTPTHEIRQSIKPMERYERFWAPSRGDVITGNCTPRVRIVCLSFAPFLHPNLHSCLHTRPRGSHTSPPHRNGIDDSPANRRRVSALHWGENPVPRGG